MYTPLVRNLQILHPRYKFDIAPIVGGAMGFVPKCLVTYLKMVGLSIYLSVYLSIYLSIDLSIYLKTYLKKTCRVMVAEAGRFF